jgi:hypothetical protein
MSGCIFFHAHPADHAPVQIRKVTPGDWAIAGAAAADTAIPAPAAFKNERRSMTIPRSTIEEQGSEILPTHRAV